MTAAKLTVMLLIAASIAGCDCTRNPLLQCAPGKSGPTPCADRYPEARARCKQMGVR